MSILIECKEKQIDLYLNNPKGKEGSYVNYCLRHFRKPYIDGGTYQNQDVWRLHELYICEQGTGEKLKKLLPYPVVNAGEWECALQIEGTPDFHGGYHGYEHCMKLEMKADDMLFSATNGKCTRAHSFEFCQYSEIYRQGTKNELLALHKKRYFFSDGRLLLHQEIIWKQSVTVRYAYMAMLPIRRTSDDTPTGEIISDSVRINGSSTFYDVKETGHQTAVSTINAKVRDVKCVEIWSDESGIVARLEIDGGLRDNTFFVQNNSTYNKLYYSYAGEGVGYVTEEGEKWELNTRYEVYFKNV